MNHTADMDIEKYRKLWAEHQERAESGEIQEVDEMDAERHRADHDNKCQREYELE